MSTEAFDAPYDAASLEFARRPVALRLEGSAADENNRVYCTVFLFLLERGSKLRDASIAAVEEERGAAVSATASQSG